MIVIRFQGEVPDWQDGAGAGRVSGVITRSRNVDGCIHFDIARDLADPDAIIATEMFADKAALSRQEALPVVQRVIEQLPEFLAGPPEATISSGAK